MSFRGGSWPSGSDRRFRLAAWRRAVAGLIYFGSTLAWAQEPVLVDRVVIRFTSPDTGGVARPRFVFERRLALLARLQALADPDFRRNPRADYLARHVRAALEQHIAEQLLSSYEIRPPPTEAELEVRLRAAHVSLLERVGGAGQFESAVRAEGLGVHEVTQLLAARARASLYLDRMVAPMLTPSETELRVVHRTTRTPFSSQPYEEIAEPLRRWYVSQRLSAAVKAFYEGARSRVAVHSTLPEEFVEAARPTFSDSLWSSREPPAPAEP